MATIAGQITRIANSRNTLRDKGIELGLLVPGGNYWDDSSNSYQSYTESALKAGDQIDKIAAAFNSISLYRDQNGNNEVRVPISVRTDGENTVVETTTLAPGYYVNTVIVPYVKVEQVEDIVINVEMIPNRELSKQSDVITPSSGFNYIGQFGYTITSGSISTTNNGYGDNFVNAIVEKSGWVDENSVTKIMVDQSEMSSKVGSTTTNLVSGSEIKPSAISDTVVTIGKGIYGSDRTITVKSVKSQTSGDALAADILSGKTAWVNGEQVTGSMPNHGGESASSEKNTAAVGIENIGGKLAITPELGYYNTYSNIITTVVYNPERVFGTGENGATVTETMTSKVYYETIPAGYYAEEILRKIEVQNCQGNVNIDYTNHTATFKVEQAGWIANDVTVDISAGPARYALSEDDLNNNTLVITPVKDQDNTITSYLTEVTVDNTVIFELLSAI